MYQLYTSNLSIILIILFIFTLFILVKTKKSFKLNFKPKHYLYILFLLIIIQYILTSFEKYILLKKYEKFSEHIIEFISDSELRKLKKPENICDLIETNSFQNKKKYILSPFNPSFGFIGEVKGDTLKYILYTNIYDDDLKNKIKLDYLYAFYPFYYRDIILCDSWVRDKTEMEFLKELEEIKDIP